MSEAHQFQVRAADKAVTPIEHTIAVIVIAGFFGLVGLLAWHAVPAENKDALNISFGALAAAFGSVVAFYFSSTARSREKDQAVTQMAEAAAKAAPVVAPVPASPVVTQTATFETTTPVAQPATPAPDDPRLPRLLGESDADYAVRLAKFIKENPAP